MDFYSLKNIKRDVEQNDLYDLFKKTLECKYNVNIYHDVVNESEEMRIDKFLKRMNVPTLYYEEFMLLNNIINPFSIKAGDVLLYTDTFSSFVVNDEEDVVVKRFIQNKGKNTRVDRERDNINTPPTFKPLNLKQLFLDKNSKKIIINNKLQ